MEGIDPLNWLLGLDSKIVHDSEHFGCLIPALGSTEVPSPE